MASGWTAGLIAPDQRVHDAAHTAIDSTGGSVTHALRQQVMGLQDSTLGSRSTGASGAPPAGTPVGSASVFQNNGIPGTIQAAMQNLNTNTQSSSLARILNQVLHGIGNGSTNQPSPAQTALFQAQTAQINQNMQAQALPGQLQNKIDALQANNPQSMGITSITPSLPGQYNPNTDNALQSLYGQQAQAKQGIRGWTAPTY